MTMAGHGRGGRLSSADPDAQRKLNEGAPEIAHLGRRIAELFRPYRAWLIVISLLVLVTAALAIVPPLLTQRIFD